MLTVNRTAGPVATVVGMVSPSVIPASRTRSTEYRNDCAGPCRRPSQMVRPPDRACPAATANGGFRPAVTMIVNVSAAESPFVSVAFGVHVGQRLRRTWGATDRAAGGRIRKCDVAQPRGQGSAERIARCSVVADCRGQDDADCRVLPVTLRHQRTGEYRRWPFISASVACAR